MGAQAGERGDAAARRRDVIATLVVAAIGAVCGSFGAASIWLSDALPSGAHVVAGWLFAAYFWFLAAVELSPWAYAPRQAPKLAAYVWAAIWAICLFLVVMHRQTLGLTGWSFEALVLGPYLSAVILRLTLQLRGVTLWQAWNDIPDDD